MKPLVRGLAVVMALFAVSCVPKKKFDKQLSETTTCYDALRKENARKKEFAANLADVRTKFAELSEAYQSALTEKGALEGNLSVLQADFEKQLAEIEGLTEEQQKLKAEAAKLAAKTETYDELVNSLKREMDSKLIEVRRQGQRIIVNVSDQILFDSGSTLIKTDGQAALAKIAEILAKVDDKRIDVEGHTDNVPITGKLAKRFPTNWELSATRATNVVRFLEDKGVDSGRMAAVGKSQYRPKAGNKTPAGRRLNCRIEIVLTPWDKQS